MDHRSTASEAIAANIRTRICSHCRWRSRGIASLRPGQQRPCEKGCEIFLHLPALIHAAQQVDPLVSYSNALAARISAIAGRNRRRPIWRYRAMLSEILRQLVPR